MPDCLATANPSPTRADWLSTATRTLCAAAVDAPRLSAELLLCHVCGISKIELATHPERQLEPAFCAKMQGLLRRRAEGEPVAYLLGRREFFGRDFRVTPATLIPRPETEHYPSASPFGTKKTAAPIRFADLGTGSGCIAVTLCAERPNWQGLAVDISRRALAIACQNATKYGVRHRIQPALADFTQPLLRPNTLDLVISNPPYVGKTEYAGLSPEVRDFEPVTALVPNFIDSDQHGHDHDHEHEHHEHPTSAALQKTPLEGLEHLKTIADAAALALKPGGLLLMEHGCEQGGAIRVWLESHNWSSVNIHKDLAGLDRLVSARKPAC
ncbi:MAG: HemK/PrmC family methyltransferase [Bilophila sp.]